MAARELLCQRFAAVVGHTDWAVHFAVDQAVEVPPVRQPLVEARTSALVAVEVAALASPAVLVVAADMHLAEVLAVADHRLQHHQCLDSVDKRAPPPAHHLPLTLAAFPHDDMQPEHLAAEVAAHSPDRAVHTGTHFVAGTVAAIEADSPDNGHAAAVAVAADS